MTRQSLTENKSEENTQGRSINVNQKQIEDDDGAAQATQKKAERRDRKLIEIDDRSG